METKDPRMQWFCKELQTLLRGITDQSFLQCLDDPKTVERLNMVCISGGEKDNVVVFIAQEGDVFETQGDILVEDSDEEWEEKEVSDDEEGTSEAGKKKTIKVKKDKAKKKYMKVFHQRIHVTMSYIPDVMNAAGFLRCAFFAKHTAEPITQADMIGLIPREDSPMRLGFEYAVLDNPSLQTMQTIMTSVFIPLLEDVPPIAVIIAVDAKPAAANTAENGDVVQEEIKTIVQSVEMTPSGIIQAEVVAWIPTRVCGVCRFGDEWVGALSQQRCDVRQCR